MPQCDSSVTCMRAVRPKPSLADLPSVETAGVSEVSRFSCMKFLGVPGVFDYAGLNRNSRYRSRTCCLPRMLTASASGLYIFAAQCPTPPMLYLRFTASLAVAAQDSRPSGSLSGRRRRARALASVRRSNCPYTFRVGSFHEDSRFPRCQ